MSEEIKKKPNDLIILGIILLIFLIINGFLLAFGKLEFDSQGIGIMISAALTIAIFSFLYKDNPLFKVAEHLFIGTAAAYLLHVMWYNVFAREIVNRLIAPEKGTPRDWIVLIPTILGIFMLCRLSKKGEVLSRISFSFVVGFFSGLAIPNAIAAWIIKQIGPTIVPLYQGGFNWDAFIILIGVISVLVYFFFSIEHKGVVGGVSKVGIYFLMISFGASFGYTVMARISLLIGRVSFLFKDWIPLIDK